jgi:aminoglycoside phosphotransferase (APT) family kinase protein
MTSDGIPEMEAVVGVDQDVPGLDLDRLSGWFARAIPGAGERLAASLIPGGRSNLTYVVSDGEHEWVVRRPPLGHVLATAHDMGREPRLMTALRDTAVPVPETYGFCDDPAIVGAPFFVMERVTGTPYRRAAELERLGPVRTRMIAARLVDTLAALHQVDPAGVGLADFGRPEGYLGRQLSRWKKQLDASHSRDLPAADELHACLAATVPDESGVGIVHGDYRLDNVLVDDHDLPTAVIDWEMATLGDPLSDLALMLVYHRVGQVAGSGSVSDVSRAPGFPSEGQVIARYAEATGKDLVRLGWHLGLASYKLAAILEGIHYRFLRGQTVGTGFDTIGEGMQALLDTGLATVREDS